MSRKRKPDNTMNVTPSDSDYPNLMNVSWAPLTFRIWHSEIIPYNKYIVVISPAALHVRQIGRKSSRVVGSAAFAMFVFCVMFQVLKGINDLAAIGTLVSLVLSQNLYAGLRKREIAAFDKGTGMFRLGGEGMKSSVEAEKRMLSAIRAIQLTDTSFSNDDNTRLYEINIVFRDISRENILRNLNLDETRHNAETLADFLNVPMLLATSLKSSRKL